MKKIKNILKSDVFLNFFVFPLIILLLADMFYKANGIVLTGFTNYAYIDCFVSIFKYPIPFLIAYIMIISFNALLIVIFNNSKISKIVLTIIVLIFVIINDFKVGIMDEPIRISDIFYLNASNGEMMVSFLDNVKGSWMFKTLFKTIGVVIILIILVKYNKNTSIKKISTRILIGVISLALMILPWININAFSSFYLNQIYPKTVDKTTINDTDVIKTYYKYGFLQGIYYFYLKDNVTSPDTYLKEEAIALLENTEYNENNTWDKPNVVIILSESLSDANNLENIEFDTDLLSNIRSYQNGENTQSFNLFVPSYGGASVNSEFEILTGANLSFFNTGYIPYTQLYNDENGPYLPNLIKEFNNNDYTTKYITAWSSDSYKSGYVYDLFEVDEKIYRKDLEDPIIKGDYVADLYMMDVIIDELTNKEEDEKKFLFVATGQNHMPCSEDRYEEYDINVKSSDYSKEDTALLRCYAQGVYDADKELKRLYDEVLKLDEPTIIALYGDHLPYMVNSKGENIYLTDSYFNTDDEQVNIMRKYTTPAVILANYDINDISLEFINANYLGSYILNNLDLEISDYFKYVNYNINILPVYNNLFIYKNDQIITLDNLSRGELEDYYNIEKVQYYKFFDYE